MEEQNSIADFVRVACLAECTAAKPGNVHPQASFDDLTYADFARSSEAIAPILADRALGIGRAVYDAVIASRAITASNAHLGTILLLAPLCRVESDVAMRRSLSKLLTETTVEDAELVYRAIRRASAGGLGQSDQQDVDQKPTVSLTEAMRLAADRDSIALQYTTDFALVFNWADRLGELSVQFSSDWERVVIRLYLELLAAVPDTLIARKRGKSIAEDVSRRASNLVRQEEVDHDALARFDRYLRSDGNGLNPGTTADLIAAILFVALRSGSIKRPEFNKETT
ncbi:triphosphoribosyl-dephospho-CoA synthase [Stratiformator vulcanicus]|uniref:ATP:dephospho-CoA triphosphoribosyl transferase n=1 Tax=Stratiformator vulcanicus TaxID=2527980 RepID=A0A517R001_9PLAN|nr:triphosphoribosyl-dephospho-CoA synthase [Stratiformator vulcanicus]QDT37163.1 ATP:dephospho-CoA triphosphoribosyl transferase [Stratiformator vulcanicus]